ncbi:protein SOB FIVE-LIKE 6-like [Benincasa hispida]|uniref:protein SOB FIVE-LIKE 6-like n=1 Tax=Benincasa hispida TaxID=102211 RepID=UPI0018FF3B59|nr:protein SOB FIVE-LIKE 6-like [Benincasa hispida]
MDLLGSECSSGCESGWTLYLEQSFLSHGGPDQIVGCTEEYWNARGTQEEEEEEGEVEDLSMVSDASSGPPHFIEDEACSHEDDGHFSHVSKSVTMGKRKGKKQRIKEYQCHEEPSSFLDDTASSPAINFTANNFTNQASMESFLGFSQTKHFEERSAFTEHFGFLQSSLSGNRLQKNQWFEGKRGIGMR